MIPITIANFAWHAISQGHRGSDYLARLSPPKVLQGSRSFPPEWVEQGKTCCKPREFYRRDRWGGSREFVRTRELACT